MPGRAADRPGVEIDPERALGEQTARSVGRLHLAIDLSVGVLEHAQQPAGAVGAVAVDQQPLTGDRVPIRQLVGDHGPGGVVGVGGVGDLGLIGDGVGVRGVVGVGGVGGVGGAGG